MNEGNSFTYQDLSIPDDKTTEYGKFDFDFQKSIVAEFQDVADKTIFKRVFW